MLRRRKPDKFKFGDGGVIEVEYTGDLPSPVFGPFVTRKRYVFSEKKNPRLVDKRDLPHLVKAAGRENLKGKKLPKPKPPEKEPTEEAAHDL